MDPITLAILGISAGTGILGMNATNAASASNNAINLMNMQAEERAREEAMRFAQQQYADSQLGMTDARGNRIYFVPGKGWVTDTTYETDQLIRAGDREEAAILNEDLPRKRRIEAANEREQGQDRYMAQGLRDMFTRALTDSSRSPGAMEALIRDASTQGINKGFDDQTEIASRNALRTGSSNAGSIFSSIGSARADALSKAFADARLRGIDASRSMKSQDLSQLGGLYESFASRAGKPVDAQFNPRDFTSQFSQAAAGLGANASKAGSNLIDAAGKTGGTMDYAPPNMGLPNALSQFGQTLMGLQSQQNGSAEQQKMMQMFMQLMKNGGYSG